MRIITVLLSLLFFCFLTVSGAAAASSAGEALPDAPNKICPLPIGSSVPAITLQTLESQTVDLQALLKTKRSILIYFRGGW
jgi:hypothetical protein